MCSPLVGLGTEEMLSLSTVSRDFVITVTKDPTNLPVTHTSEV